MHRYKLLKQEASHILIGVGASLVLLLLASQGVKWADLLHSLGRVDPLLTVAGVAFLMGSLVARALRWRALLAPLVRAPFSDTFSCTMIGYLVNNVLPFRLGEVARAGLLGEKLQVSKTGVFATVVVERILDVLSLVAFVAVLMIVLDLDPVIRGSIMLAELMAVAAILVLCWLAWRGQDVGRLMPGFVPQALRARLVGMLASFVRGLQVLRSARQVLAASSWSLLSWCLFTVSMFLLVRAAGLDRLPWYAPLLIIVVTNLGSAIPSSPGFVGGYHYLAVLALGFWSVPRSEALSAAILLHGAGYVVVTGLGALALLRENLAFGQLRRHARASVTLAGAEESG